MDRRAWPATVHGVTKSQAQLSNFQFTSGGSMVKNMPASAGDTGLIPG